jgi:hypothetical protein
VSTLTIEQLAVQVEAMQAEIKDLRAQLRSVTPVSSMLSLHERARMMQEAHASGDRARIRRTAQQLNGVRS